MGSKSKTRFAVKMNGTERELFSVRERQNGDLVILLKHAKHYEDTSGPIETDGQKYSVHRSPLSPGFTIKHTLNLKGGGQMDTAQYRLPGEHGPCSLLFGRTTPDLSPDKYKLASRAKDRVIPLYEDDIEAATLFYFLLTCDPTFDAATIKTQTKITTAQFEHFQLICLSGLFFVPPVDGADFVHVSTSAPRYDPSDKPIYYGLPTETKHLQYWVGMAEAYIPMLAELFYARLQTKPFVEDSMLPRIREMLSIYGHSPRLTIDRMRMARSRFESSPSSHK